MEDYSAFYDMIEEFLILGIVLCLIIFAVAIVAIIANWKMYKKAGKGGWECIVPIYGYWVLTEIAGLKWWWFLLAIADSIVSIIGIDDLDSIANLISLFATFNIYYNIAIRFNKDKGTSILAGIFSGIFVLIFGFSKKEVYNVNIPVSENGIFGTPVSSYNNTQTAPNYDNNVNQDDVFCRNCGTKLDKNVRFCHICGKENI